MSSERVAALVAAVAFAGLSLASALQGYVVRRAQQEAVTVWQALLLGFATWAIWLVFTPGILWLGRRFDFRRGRRTVSAVVHILGVVACHIPSTWLLTWLGGLLFATRPIPASEVWRIVLTSARLQSALLIYAAILGVGRAAALWRALRERELQASRLEAQAARARLEALASRLQPHFLFNTLHAVGALIDEDPARARVMLAQLGDLLRDVLADPGETEVPLAQELVLLQRYLAIEQTRFADRLRVELDISPDAAAIRVPRFLLQPLAENALRHGIAPRGQPGILRIEAARRGDRLQLRLWNDGLPLDPARREGVGLTTTRERLSTSHGAAASLAVRAAAQGGVETVVELPAA